MTPTIVVYAASGTLGRRVSRELAAHGATVRLGGRNPETLEAAAVDLRREGGWQGSWQTAALDDAAGLHRMLDGCRVVVNAGPTAGPGERLIEAAIEAGVHYVDAAGSQPFISRVFEHYGMLAERRGVALAPAFGFDYALGDCLAFVAARTGGNMERAQRIVVAYAIDGSDVSANSLQFAAETRAGGEVFYEAGAWKPARLGVFRHAIEFPAPFGRQPMTRYAAGEIVTIPRHTPTDAVTALITSRSLVPHPALLPLFPYLRPLVALARRTPARHLLGLAAALRRPPAPASPDEPAPQPRPPRFAVVVEMEQGHGTTRRGVVEGGDFHQVTAAALACGARALAAPSFSSAGALAPAQVVDAEGFLNALRSWGVTWRCY